MSKTAMCKVGQNESQFKHGRLPGMTIPTNYIQRNIRMTNVIHFNYYEISLKYIYFNKTL